MVIDRRAFRKWVFTGFRAPCLLPAFFPNEIRIIPPLGLLALATLLDCFRLPLAAVVPVYLKRMVRPLSVNHLGLRHMLGPCSLRVAVLVRLALRIDTQAGFERVCFMQMF